MVTKDERARTRSTLDRWVTAAFGLFFVGIAVAIVYSATNDNPWGAGVAALATGALGLDAIVAAWRGRASLLSRIGPLP
jgi:hypothetical protein